MKSLITSLLIIFFFTSCSSDVSYSELVKRDNTYYKVNSDNPFSGNVVDYHNKENKIKSIEGSFKNGKHDGKWITYYSNGQIKETWNYNVGILNGKHNKYKKNGQFIKEENYKDGQKDGIWSTYFNSGTKDKVTEYKHGLKNGIYIEYYSDGYFGKEESEGYKIKGNYISNLKNGKWVYKDRNSYVTKIENYQDETLNGYFEETFWSKGFNENRVNKLIKIFGNYDLGFKDGIWSLTQAGQIIRENVYENGEDISFYGTWKSINLSNNNVYYVKINKNKKYYFSKNKSPYSWTSEDLWYKDSYKYYQYRSWYPYSYLAQDIIIKEGEVYMKGWKDVLKLTKNKFVLKGGYGNMKYEFERIGKISTTNAVENSKNTSIEYSDKIRKLLKAEENRDFDKIKSFFAKKIQKYWNVNNITQTELKNQYEKSWEVSSNSKNQIQNIDMINDNIYVLNTIFSFYHIKQQKEKSIKSSVKFEFDNNGKIIKIYENK